MNTYLDCLPCFVRQALDAARMATTDQKTHEAVLREVLKATAGMMLDRSPPVMGQEIHRMIRRVSGNRDPYRKVKAQFTRYALRLYPECRTAVEGSGSPFETALRFAAAANAIDFGAVTNVEMPDSRHFIQQAVEATLHGNVLALKAAAGSADTILFIADNAGEIVFDRLLIEQLPPKKVVLAVRGAPVINDATMTDAREAGITALVETVDTGSDAPGIVLEDCSEGFRRRFEEADMVIAKGQGNYETLSGVAKKVFFVLKVKCRVIACHIGYPPGALVAKSPNET